MPWPGRSPPAQAPPHQACADVHRGSSPRRFILLQVIIWLRDRSFIAGLLCRDLVHRRSQRPCGCCASLGFFVHAPAPGWRDLLPGAVLVGVGVQVLALRHRLLDHPSPRGPSPRRTGPSAPPSPSSSGRTARDGSSPRPRCSTPEPGSNAPSGSARAGKRTPGRRSPLPPVTATVRGPFRRVAQPSREWSAQSCVIRSMQTATAGRRTSSWPGETSMP